MEPGLVRHMDLGSGGDEVLCAFAEVLATKLSTVVALYA